MVSSSIVKLLVVPFTLPDPEFPEQWLVPGFGLPLMVGLMGVESEAVGLALVDVCSHQLEKVICFSSTAIFR